MMHGALAIRWPDSTHLQVLIWAEACASSSGLRLTTHNGRWVLSGSPGRLAWYVTQLQGFGAVPEPVWCPEGVEA